jgi:hypothetical protein
MVEPTNRVVLYLQDLQMKAPYMSLADQAVFLNNC